MVPESWIKERRRRTPTGMGLIIDVEGEMKKSGVPKLIDRIQFTISPVRAGERNAFKVHRRAVFSNGKIGGGNEGPFASVADAVRSCRTWLHLNVVTAKRQPPKWEQVDTDGYYRGGDGTSYRKVVLVAGDMAHWCDSIGPGACRVRSFADWMTEKVDAVPVQEANAIQEAMDRHGISKAGYRLGAFLFGMPEKRPRDEEESTIPAP